MKHLLLADGLWIIVGIIAAVVVIVAAAVIIAVIVKKNSDKKNLSQNTLPPPVPVESDGEPIAEEPAPVPVQEPAVQQPAFVFAEETAAEEPAPVLREELVAQQPAFVFAEETAAEEPAPVLREEPVAQQPAPVLMQEPVAEVPAPVSEDEPAPVQETEKIVIPLEEKRVIRRIVVLPSNRLVNVRYDKSFTAKLMQTTDVNKEYYTELKNELLSYKKVRSRISWRQDSFRKGRDTIAKMAVRGKTLCLYLALDPAKYEETKYIVEDVSEVKKNEDTPCLYRIKNGRRLKYAKELIAELMEKAGAEKQEIEPVNYAADYPYEETLPLLERGLVKLIEERRKMIEEELPGGQLEIEVPREVTVAAAEELLKDEIAQVLVRDSERESMRGKQTIVNVDTLGEYFEEGETVTLELMRERIPFLNKKAVVVKVLARGSLSKALEVEADDFSLAAVKMIILAGGNAYRKRTEID